jgi:hypothetical protein
MAKRRSRTRTVYRTARRTYRRAGGASGLKNHASKFLAGMGMKQILGTGLLGIGGAYLVADWEGAAGALLGDTAISTLGSLAGSLGLTAGTTAGATGNILGNPP